MIINLQQCLSLIYVTVDDKSHATWLETK